MRIRFAGFGGQGVVLSGFIFGQSAMLDGKNAIHTQEYGSASRGGSTKSDVCIEDGEIYDLVADDVDVLVAMSQQSYDKYRHDLLEGGSLFYETDLVQLDEVDTTEPSSSRVFGIQATDIAFKQFGRKIMANMVMTGFVNQIVEIVSYESLARTIGENVPAGTEQKNIAALNEGMRLGKRAIEA